MKITPLKDIVLTSSNLVADTTPLWDIDTGYALGITRKYNDRLYESLGVIDPLVTYIYNNNDPLAPHITTVANTGVEVVDNTAVPCYIGVTTIYVVGNGYYIFDNAGALPDQGGYYNVDFTTEPLENPVHFSATTVVRHNIEYPNESLLWFDNGYINEKRMFDKSTGSQTTNTGDIVLQFDATRIDTIAFMNITDITSVNITITNDTATELYNEDFQTSTRGIISDWYEYYYTDFISKNNLIVDGLILGSYTYSITISGVNPKIGMLGIGRSEFLGGTKYGAKISMIDYSKKLIDSNGDWYIQEGKFARTNDLQLEVDTISVDLIIERLDDLRATPIIFNGSDNFSSMKIYGVYNSYDCIVNLPSKSILSLELESLT